MPGLVCAASAPEEWTWLRKVVPPFLVTLMVLVASASGAEVAERGEPGAHALDGRSRFEMRLGFADLYVSDNQLTDAVDVTGGAFSLVFLHWMSESLAIEVSLGAMNVGVSSRETIAGETVRADGFGGFLAGGRFYPQLRGPIRPHVGLAVGPMTDYQVRDRPWQTDVILRTTTVGVGLEAGIDCLLGRHFVLGVHGGTTARDGYSPQWNLGINLGWAFGGAQGSRPSGG